MLLGHILGEGATDELVATAVVVVGLILLLRRSERKARQRRQAGEGNTSEEQG